MSYRRLLGAAVLLATLAACKGKGGDKTTTTSPPSTTTTRSAPLFAPTNLTVNGFSPGVNQPPFYPTATVRAVTCPAGQIVFTVPPGGSGTAMSVATTVVIVKGRADVKDSAGKVLYTDLQRDLTPASHGSIVLAMSNVAGTDSAGRRVAAGSVNVSGAYLCP